MAGRIGSSPWAAVPKATAMTRTPVVTARAARTEAALRIAQANRPIGAARTTSRRRSLSSEAQPPTKNAAARPITMIPSSKKASCRNPAVERMSASGKSWVIIRVICGIFDSCSTKTFADEARMIPNRPRKAPQTSAPGNRSPRPLVNGPLTHKRTRGTGIRPPVGTRRSRRANASTPATSSTATAAARIPTAGQSHVPASGRWPFVRSK